MLLLSIKLSFTCAMISGKAPAITALMVIFSKSLTEVLYAMVPAVKAENKISEAIRTSTRVNPALFRAVPNAVPGRMEGSFPFSHMVYDLLRMGISISIEDNGLGGERDMFKSDGLLKTFQIKHGPIKNERTTGPA